MTAQTITLGCRLNFAESEAMRALAGDDTIILVCAEGTGGAPVAADLATLAGL